MPPLLTEEHLLIQNLKARERKAFDMLYENYHAALFGVIMRIVKNSELAEELLHDAFIKIWDKINYFDPQKGRLFTWMLNIARNLAIDATRSKSFSQAQKTITDSEFVYENSSSEVTTTYSGMDKLLGKLPEEQLFLINKVFYEGYTHSEVAKSFEIPLGTVKTRIRSAVKSLGRMIAK